MRIAFIFYCLISMAQAENLAVTLLSDSFNEQGLAEGDIATQLLFDAHESIANKVTLTIIPSSPKREWHKLASEDNVCLYNKTKNNEREAIGVFSKRPLLAFPPNRLVTRKQTEIPDALSIDDAINKYQLSVGIINGRSYGKPLDTAIAKHKHKMIVLEGSTGVTRLRKMLISGRLDAIIEYWPSILVSTVEKEHLDNLQVHVLHDATQFTFGYLVCSQSIIGKRVIDLFDEVMTQAQYFETVLKAHKNQMPKEEFLMIREALISQYQ